MELKLQGNVDVWGWRSAWSIEEKSQGGAMEISCTANSMFDILLL